MTYPEASGNGWRLINGDCLDVMATLERVDVICADPPYEIEAHTKARRSLKDATQKKGARNKGEVRRIDAPLELDFAAITPEKRAAAAQHWARLARRWVVAFCQVEGIAPWRSSLEAGGLEWVRGGAWIKPNGTPQFTGDRPAQGFECLAIAHPKGRKRWNGGGRHAVWTVPLDHYAHKELEHPTIKPVALMLQLVADFTDPGELVLDPFAGSGTTGVACLRLGRHFIGIERSAKHFKEAAERLRAEEAQTTVAAARSGQEALFG